MEGFRVPIGIYRVDKRLAVGASVPIAAGGPPQRMWVNQTRRGVTQGNAILLRAKGKKTERGDGREMNLRETH